MNKLNCILIGLFLVVGWSFQVQGQTKDTTSKQSESNKKVEVVPEFIGGDEARQKFISDNLIYPDEAKEMAIEGTVVIDFTIEPDGSITNVVVFKSVNKLLDAEAIRVTKLMPKWNPGTQDEEPVRVRFRMPVEFKLKD